MAFKIKMAQFMNRDFQSTMTELGKAKVNSMTAFRIKKINEAFIEASDRVKGDLLGLQEQVAELMVEGKPGEFVDDAAKAKALELQAQQKKLLEQEITIEQHPLDSHAFPVNFFSASMLTILGPVIEEPTEEHGVD